MNTNEYVKISLSLLILNDLHRTKAIGDDVYNLALQKLYETDQGSLASTITIKEIA